MPILRSDFDHEMQRLFIGAMANAAIVQVDTLTIKNIEPVTSHRRHARQMLAANGIKVDLEVAGKDKTMATSIVKLLTADNINAELVNVGLPKAVFVSTPELVMTAAASSGAADHSYSNSKKNTYVALEVAAGPSKSDLVPIVAGCVGGAMCLIVAIWYFRKRKKARTRTSHEHSPEVLDGHTTSPSEQRDQRTGVFQTHFTDTGDGPSYADKDDEAVFQVLQRELARSLNCSSRLGPTLPRYKQTLVDETCYHL